MEECIDHFSHEHPLMVFKVDDDEDPKPHRCTICGLPILSTPSYTCTTTDCNFFLHKPCAELMLKEVFHRLHDDTLVLERGGDCTSFVYRCRNYARCEFQLHPLVVKPVEIRTKHISHESHPLVAFCKEIVCVCCGCGEEEKGFFFYCQHEECNFWIHEKCTVLPIVVKLPHHEHPYILTYSLTNVPSTHHSDNTYLIELLVSGRWTPDSCKICSKAWRLPKCGVYHCAECNNSLAHVACATNSTSMDILDPEREFIRLPDDEVDSFPSLNIRRFVERNQEKTNRKHHHHDLIQASAISDAVCDVCTQPLSLKSPSYKCQLLECPFTAHEICACHLPASFNMYTGSRSRELVLHCSTQSSFNPIFHCHFCSRRCNGYACDDGQLRFDLECSLAPKTIKHTSHKRHLLSQTSMEESELARKLRCCSLKSLPHVYACVICNDFCIHVRCALLPKRTRNKFDPHPLELIMTAHDHYDRVQFCEFCEKEIELKLWYYGCHECEQYFHINCIPSVGHLSKIKFGKTYDDHRLHQHPLTLTRMLTHGFNERCGVCNEIITGFADDGIALRCSPCLFWLHFSCAYNTSGSMDCLQLLPRVLRRKDFPNVDMWSLKMKLHFKKMNK